MECMPSCCPQCRRFPAITTEAPNTIILRCEEHGHIAQGLSLDQAIAHWNRYIEFIRKAA
jgi:uncharacterized radical SAM superfamily Fe-S cluster-containing enzyme